MKLSELLYDISFLNKEKITETDILGISCDSRTAREKMIFVAVATEKEERLAHIKEAKVKGVSVIVCFPEDEEKALHTDNPRETYALLSGNWFGNPSGDLVLIGVTGTNGKTTTTHFIKAMLEGVSDAKVGLIGTNENMIGQRSLPSHRTTPDAFELQGLLREMVDENCTHVVMEVSSHALAQYRCGGLAFAVGIFTNLTQDHLDYHHSMTEYAKVKGRLFSQSEIAIFNLDDETGRNYCDLRRKEGKPFFSYSENKDYASLYGENVTLHANKVTFDCREKDNTIPVEVPVPGGFTLYNALAALCCAYALQIELSLAAMTFPVMSGVKGRVEVIPCPSPFTLLIDYAHTPNALENILLTAQNFTENRLICVFGCGGNRDRSKRAIMGEIAEDLADLVVVTSDNPRFEDPEEIIQDILQGMKKEATVICDRKEAICYALSQGKEGDVVLLAGKGHECYQEICGQQYPMDEREIVAEYYRETLGISG
ncbi:MAG: UDP-N-acetylmuramoyl-L-alanyl-D-glutamate--2,6-diaminopimelate ligase [Eubacteriales bacterium]